MKRLFAFLLLFIFPCVSQASIVYFSLTNWYGTTATNRIKITPVADTPLIDGSFIQTGNGQWYSPTNGVVTNSTMNGGNYQLDIAGMTYLHPAFFAVPQSDTNTFNVTNLFVSGGNFFNYYPGIRQIIAGDNVTVTPANGVGQVVVSTSGGGSATNVIARPLSNIQIITNVNGSDYSYATVTNPVFTSVMASNPAAGGSSVQVIMSGNTANGGFSDLITSDPSKFSILPGGSGRPVQVLALKITAPSANTTVHNLGVDSAGLVTTNDSAIGSNGAAGTFNANQFDNNASGTNIKSGAIFTNTVLQGTARLSAAVITNAGSAFMANSLGTLADGTMVTNAPGVTNHQSTPTTFDGRVTFATPYGADGQNITRQTNRGPGDYIFDGLWDIMAPVSFSGISAFRFMDQTDANALFTMGYNNNTGNYDPIPRSYGSTYSASTNTSQQLGVSESAHFDYVGGRGSTLSALPVHGQEIWSRMPVPPIVFTTWNTVVNGTNNCNEAYVSNVVRNINLDGLVAACTNKGIPIMIDIDAGWHGARDGGGYQTWNTTIFPHGIPFLANYCHTNTGRYVQLQMHQYFSGRVSNNWFSALSVIQTPSTVNLVGQDIYQFYTWGIDSLRIGDGATEDANGSPGFSQLMTRQIGQELLYPGGFVPIQKSFTNLMSFSCFMVRQGQSLVNPGAAYEINQWLDDQGDQGGPNAGVAIDNAMFQARLTWTNYAQYAGKGHYFSAVYPTDVGVINTADLQALLAMGVMFPYGALFYTNNPSTTLLQSLTNDTYLTVFSDAMQNPGFPIYDNGGGSTSAWCKPMQNGKMAIIMANETAGSLSMSVNWSNMVSPVNFMPVGTVSYPFSVRTNQGFSVSDIWNGTDKGIQRATFSDTVAAHTATFYLFTPVPVVIEADQSLSDVTTANASTSKHGYGPKGDGNASHYLDGTYNWSTPAGGGGSSGWSTNGNTGRLDQTNFLGTTDTTPITINENGSAFTFWTGTRANIIAHSSLSANASGNALIGTCDGCSILNGSANSIGPASSSIIFGNANSISNSTSSLVAGQEILMDVKARTGVTSTRPSVGLGYNWTIQDAGVFVFGDKQQPSAGTTLRNTWIDDAVYFRAQNGTYLISGGLNVGYTNKPSQGSIIATNSAVIGTTNLYAVTNVFEVDWTNGQAMTINRTNGLVTVQNNLTASNLTATGATGTNYMGANLNINGTINSTGETNSSLTASRIMLTDANKAQSSAAASGAVPIDANGSATTFAQINALAQGAILTNGGYATSLAVSNLVVGTNSTTFATNAFEVYTTNGVLGFSVCDTNGYITAPNLIAMSTTADNAAVGNLGEYVESLIASGSATALTTATAKNVTSISLTAGDWDVSGSVNFSATTATVTGTSGGISSTSATVPTDGSEVFSGVQVTLVSENDSVTLPRKRFSLSATTTVYLIAKSTFSAGSVSAFGQINARRVR